jgi:transposase
MQNTIVHYEGTASPEAVAIKVKPRGARIKIGPDVHARLYVAVAHYGHLLPKAARRLHRQLIAAGAHCNVIGPRKLDEECSRAKTDPCDATTLCQRLSRYLEGNTRELAVIRVPSQEEEQARHVSRQRTQLVCQRQKLEAQGRSLFISHALPAPAHWWKEHKAQANCDRLHGSIVT